MKRAPFVFLSVTTALVLGALAPGAALAQQEGVTVGPSVTVYDLPAYAANAVSLADMATARPMPLPRVDFQPVGQDDVSTERSGSPGFSPGARGTGRTSPVRLPEEAARATRALLDDLGADFVPQEYGTSNQPFTTARVDTSGRNVSPTFPYSPAGKLYFKIGTSSFVCSASLIKRGVIVTAAHCVAAFGKKTFYAGWQFVPARYNTVAPFGTWTAAKAFVKSSYFDGTDPCASSGVVCQDDVAVIRLAGKADPATGTQTFPGTQTGWLGYGYNGYGFTPGNLALISQLGYPVSHDSGLIMQRTDSQGFVSSSLSGNTIWGSRMTGGSSGGPEIVNLGIRGSLSTTLGSEAKPNLVVGVTSWGYTDPAVKEEGASPFTSTNIVPLVSSACSGSQPACQ